MSSVVAMTLIGLLAAIVGAAVIPLLLHGYSQDTIHAAQWFMVFAPETLITYAARAHLESRNEFTRSTLILFYPAILTLAGLCVFRVSGNLTPLTGALSYIVPTALQGIYLIVRLWKPRLFSFKKIVSDVTLLLPFGLSCYGNDIVNTLAGQIDLVVIVSFLSPTDLGLYTVALSLSRQLNIVYASVTTVLFSRASSLEPNDAFELAGRAARLSTALCFGLGIIFVAVIHFALPLLYGSTFVTALQIIPTLTVEAILSGLASVLFAGFMAAGRPAYVTTIQVCWVGTAIVLLFLLVPRMDLNGAATALLIAAVVRLGLILLTYPLVLHRAVPGLLITSSDIAYIRKRLEITRLSREPIAS